MSIVDRLLGNIDFLETREVTARERFIDPAGNVHEGEIGGNVDGDHIQPASVSTKSVSDATRYASEYADLNAVGNDVVPGETVELPAGTTTFSDFVQSGWGGVTIEGAGPGESVLQSDGSHRVVSVYGAAPEMTFRDLTIDMNNVSLDGGVFHMAGDMPLRFENVRFENIDFSTTTNDRGIVDVNANLSSLVFEDCEFAFDTVTGNADYKCMAAKVQGSNRVTRFRAESCHFEGLISTDRTTREYYNAFQVKTDGMATVHDCTFYRLDQYATFLNADGDGATVHITDNTSRHGGDGDQFRAGGTGNGEVIHVEGNTVGGVAPTADVGTNAPRADRGIIIQGGGADTVTVRDNTIRDSLVGFDIQRGCRSLFVVGNNLYNCGHYDAANSTRPGILTRTNVRNLGFVTIRDNHIINETSDRAMEPAIEVRETDGNSTEDAVVTENTCRGYETNATVVSATTSEVRDNST